MTESQLVLRCPYCNWTFDAKPPDTWHSAYSFEKPVMSNSHGDVKEQEILCQKCRKKFAVYWYAQMEYFNRM
jgi:uncharacterized CHY-type Zn-finger protein